MIINIANEQLNDLLIHLDKVHSLLTNTDAKDLIHSKDLDRVNNDWRNFVVKLMNSEKKKHPTEQKYPEQTKRFREIIEQMYQMHLEKNADYSPMNILSTGIVGLATRIWDKTIRFVSLIGLDARTGEWNRPKEPKNESIEDTLLDLANYAIIALIYRAEKWAK